MSSSKLPVLYVEDPRKIVACVRLSDEEYGRAIQRLPVVCSDILITPPLWILWLKLLISYIFPQVICFYLAQRKARPAKGWWWFIGGGVKVGETEVSAARRCFKYETSLDFPEARFMYLGTPHRIFFADREQDPTDVGCDSLTFTFMINMEEHERNSIVLDQKEYQNNGLRPFSFSMLKSVDGISVPLRDICNRLRRRVLFQATAVVISTGILTYIF